MTVPLPERVTSKIDQRSPDDCWPYQGGLRNGYGIYHVTVDGRLRSRMVTHLMLALDGRPVPPGLCALHTCDNRACCNPRHLYVGDHHQNVRDRVSRGRSRGAAPGAKHHAAKFTAEQVATIRQRVADGETQAAVAAAFGASGSHINMIVRRRRYNDGE